MRTCVRYISFRDIYQRRASVWIFGAGKRNETSLVNQFLGERSLFVEGILSGIIAVLCKADEILPGIR